MRRTTVMMAASLLALAGCPRTQPLAQLDPAHLVATPLQLVLAPTYVGQRAVGAVSVANTGQATGVVEVSVALPFTVDVSHLELVRGESAALTVAFQPTAAGHAAATLQVGTLEVQVEAEGLEVPACLPSSVCVDARFEPADAQCLEAPKAEGTSCETRCVTGSCSAGTCLGQLKGCTGGNACTVAACDEATGCSYLPRTCPEPTTPCQVARCDAATGCGTEDAPDGTLCGPDDCLATQVDVCIVGQCVTRTRPDTGRCANTWLPASVLARSEHALAYDAARQRVLLFGGRSANGEDLSDTWEWDGVTWAQRTPVASPPARHGHRLAYDASRQRVVLFGGAGAGPLSDTWEWDGTTWVSRTPATSPPARLRHAMAYDAARQRVVLFGGEYGFPFSDTWEWDGTSWAVRTPAAAPSARRGHSLAYDAARQRVVLFGGNDGGSFSDLSDTWEWDGTTWLQRTPATSPAARAWHGLAYDAARQRTVLFGGASDADVWEWDGTAWARQTSGPSPGVRSAHALAYDAARQRVLLLGGRSAGGEFLSDSWEWDGTGWRPRSAVTTLRARTNTAMAYDADRQRVVLFGGNGGSPLADTQEWDGTAWATRTPATSPPARSAHAVAYDAARRRLVLFGGDTGSSARALASDTWEWDGTSWAQRTPAAAPSARRGHSLAYDALRQRVVLFGGRDQSTVLADTWEWDGTSWVEQLPATAPPARAFHAAAFDAARQRVVLFGGSLDDDLSGVALADTWEWDGTSWVDRTPARSPPQRMAHAVAYDLDRQRLVLFGGVSFFGDDTWEWDGASWLQRLPTQSPTGNRFGHALAYDAARQRTVLFGGDTPDTWVWIP